MPWATADAATEAGQREFTERTATHWEAGTDFVFLMLVGDQTIVGVTGLHRRVGDDGLEIGYWVDRNHTRRGYATAAARALTYLALGIPGVERVEIHCDQANVASQAVPHRLGYQLDRVDPVAIDAPGEIGKQMVWVWRGKRSGPSGRR